MAKCPCKDSSEDTGVKATVLYVVIVAVATFGYLAIAWLHAGKNCTPIAPMF